MTVRVEFASDKEIAAVDAAASSKQVEIIASLDVEANGSNPLTNSLWSFALAAFTIEKELVASITFNLEEELGSVADPKTIVWWEQQAEAFKRVRENLVPPAHAFRCYRTWWNRLTKFGYPYLAAAPVGYDAVLFSTACFRYLGKTPHQRMALDLRSLASGALGLPLWACGKQALPRNLFDEAPHTHIALDDAIEQGALFVNLLRQSRKLPEIKGFLDLRKPENVWDYRSQPCLKSSTLESNSGT